MHALRAWPEADLDVVLAREVAGRGVRAAGLGEVGAETGKADVEKKIFYVRRHALVGLIVKRRKAVEGLEGLPSAGCDSKRSNICRYEGRTLRPAATRPNPGHMKRRALAHDAPKAGHHVVVHEEGAEVEQDHEGDDDVLPATRALRRMRVSGSRMGERT